MNTIFKFLLVLATVCPHVSRACCAEKPIEVRQAKKRIAISNAVYWNKTKDLQKLLADETVPVDLNYETVLGLAKKREIIFTELGKFQPVFRDLAIIVDKWLPFSGLQSTIKKLNLTKLQEIRLFDVFESDKLGANKKSLALNFTFVDENKTLTDKEIDAMMQQIIIAIEKQLNGEIRK